MAQTYTLEEAAAKLSLSLEEFKRRLRIEWASKVRPMRDGNTLRFRANEIEELGRSIGVGSSEEMQLGDSEATVAAPVPTFPSPKKPASKDVDEPLNLDSDEVFLMPGEDAGKPASSKHLKGKSSSDSDIRLRGTKKKAAQDEDDESILGHLSEDEFELPTGGSSVKLTGKSGKLSSIKLKSSESGSMPRPEMKSHESGSMPRPELPKGKDADNDSSEFELSLDADSDDFELSMMPDSSEEVSLGGEPLGLKDASGQSGINLNRPADSGVSLEGKGGKSGKNLGGKSGKMPKPAPQPESDSEIDFELSIDSTGASSNKLKKKPQGDSSSEFELSLEEPSDLSLDLDSSGVGNKKGDIFEATDFEIPALEDDSASEAISLDDADTDLESSEFDLAIDEDGVVADDESASEVVSIDEDEVQTKRKNIRKLKGADSGVDFDDMEEEEGSSASKALAGVKHDDDEDGEEYEVSESAEDGSVRPGSYAPAQWGALPAILMMPTMVVLFIGSLMAYELMHGMWGYQQSNKPTTPLINTFAETLGMKPAQ